MKKKILFVLSFIFIFATCLFACDAIKLSGGPKKDDIVYGNGGSAVVKGDYLYFCNAYNDYTTLGANDNKYDKNSAQKIYAIYRVKLNNDGVVDLDDNGAPSGVELIVPQVGGYKKSSLYVCGDYLYYTTPYSAYKKGESSLTTGLLRFERVNLDGTGHLILSEGEYSVDNEYYFNYIDDTTYITILHDNTISVIKSKGGNKSNYDLASSVEGFAVASQSKLVYGQKESDVNKYVYYVKKTDSNYSIYKKSFTNGTENVLTDPTTEETKIVCVKNDRVYYKVNNILYSSSFANNEVAKQYTTYSIADDNTSNGVVDYIILDDTFGSSQDRGIYVEYYTGSTYLIAKCNNGEVGSWEPSFQTTSQMDFVFFTNNEIYYQIRDDTSLYAFNIETKIHRTVITNFTKSCIDDSTVDTFDFDEERVFFFATVEDSNGNYKYLQIASLNASYYKDDSNNSIAHYIGIFDLSDVKTETED